MRKELVAAVRKSIGPIATPDTIHWAPGMPKTRSGKIMRRILRKIANKWVVTTSVWSMLHCVEKIGKVQH